VTLIPKRFLPIISFFIVISAPQIQLRTTPGPTSVRGGIYKTPSALRIIDRSSVELAEGERLESISGTLGNHCHSILCPAS